ncbi:LamG-like jellyroll fold domain-containing protein [Mesorhizobium sp.]|uniref:LamG-like jellyroll fold domain-containing protein n=1 Tax=Mesorhizobium sp. TaxID=1871066 RepID=UPI00121FEC3F|nr:LamG-like jellyroll fold domain-containing protein [Mesorhizobium sp.]TIN80694.1 MAG: LamG domain-containing protein [Mesorhizobium sp.]
MFIAKLGEAITDTAGVPQALALIPSLIADADDGVFFDFADLTRMWKESAGTNLVTADADLIGKVASPYGSHSAIQPTAGMLGTYRAAGGGIWRGDGSNDWLDLVGFLLSVTGGNTISMKITPAAGSAGKSFAGFGSANRFSLGLDASGFLLASYGTAASAIVGAADLRSTTFVATITHDDTNVQLYHNATLVGSVAKAGAHSTAFTPALGAAKHGTAGVVSGGYVPGDIRKCLMLAGRHVAADEVAEIVAAF